MNERMFELALDAGLLNYVDNETPRRYFIDGNADLEELQKFAELIVRECTDAINNNRSLDGVRLAANGCVRTIQTHFDVYE